MAEEFRFEGFRLVPAENLLEHEGTPVPLTPKVFRLLTALVETRGRLIKKDDLIRQVWPDLEYVEANAFDQTLFVLRKKLAQFSTTELVVTVPRQGYRWNGEVIVISGRTIPPASPAEAPSRFRRALWAGLSLAVAAIAGWGILSAKLPRWEVRNPEAVKELNQGIKLWRLRQFSADHFRRALRLEPEWAQAHVAFAAAYALSESPAPEAFLAVDKALALDPDSGEAFAVLGFLRMVHRWDWNGAGEAFQKAIALAPESSMARHWYALYLRSLGRIGEARVQLEEAARLDPDSPAILDDIGTQALTEGRGIEAVEQFSRVGKLHPDYHFWKANLWKAVVLRDGKEHATTYLLDSLPERNRKSVQQAIEKGVSTWEAAAAEHGHTGAAILWAIAGNNERALRSLEAAVDQHEFTVFTVKTDPFLRSLRGEPRYQAVLKRIGLQ